MRDGKKRKRTRTKKRISFNATTHQNSRRKKVIKPRSQINYFPAERSFWLDYIAAEIQASTRIHTI